MVSRPGLAALVALAVLAVSTALVPAFGVGREAGDLVVFYGYARKVVGGMAPYRDLRLEYPPGALAAIVTPAVGRPSPRVYALRFEVAMLVLLAVTIALLGGGKRAAFVVALSPLLLGPVVCQRFDALPALLTLAALLLALRGRYSWSAATLGIGTAVKLYPLLLMPLVVAAAGRRGGAKALAAFGFAVTCLLAPFLAIAPHGVAAAIHDQLGRHLQMETPLASAALLAQSLAGVNFGLVSQAHSFALGGTRGFVLAVLTTAAFLASLASVWRRMPRLVASREGMIVGWAATLCTAVALGRVLSPQYLIWLLPVVPLVGRGPTLLLVAALVLTNIWYPTQYSAAVHGHGDAIPLLVGRNIVLIALLVVLLRNVSSRSA